MNGSKDKFAHGGGASRGAGSGSSRGHGLRGGKIKPFAGRRIDSDIVIDQDISRDAGDIASGKRRSKTSYPKHPNKKVVVDKNNVWRHGPYVMIESPEGRSAFRRVGVGSYSNAGDSDEMAVGLSNNTAPLRDGSHDTVDDDDDVSSEDLRDGHGSDDVNIIAHRDGGGDDGDDGVWGGDGDSNEKELIHCNKNGFTNKKVSKSVKEILEQCYDGDWVTWKKVPHNIRMRLFDRFRTKYRWDPQVDQAIYDTFIKEIQSRFRDFTRNLREKSKQKAKDANCKVPKTGYDFGIQLDHPPDGIPREKWQRMCANWNTEKWQIRSMVGRSNRKNELCRHTGGSIRFHQHRVNMEKEEGRAVGYMKVFLQTHLTKECKKLLQDGEITENDLGDLKFVNDRAKCSYVAYKEQMKKLHPNEDCDDLAVWMSLHPECKGRQMFGVGSSDPDFVVTGKQSSIISGSAQQSQELQKVQAELEREQEARQNIEARFEQFQQEREQERADQAAWRKSMEEMVKNIGKK